MRTGLICVPHRHLRSKLGNEQGMHAARTAPPSMFLDIIRVYFYSRGGDRRKRIASLSSPPSAIFFAAARRIGYLFVFHGPPLFQTVVGIFFALCVKVSQLRGNSVRGHLPTPGLVPINTACSSVIDFGQPTHTCVSRLRYFPRSLLLFARETLHFLQRHKPMRPVLIHLRHCALLPISSVPFDSYRTHGIIHAHLLCSRP